MCWRLLRSRRTTQQLAPRRSLWQVWQSAGLHWSLTGCAAGRPRAGSGTSHTARAMCVVPETAPLTRAARMLCTRVDADGLLCRVDRAAGSEWRWADSLRPDPIAELFFAAAVSPIKLEYSASRGRCVIAKRRLRRGALLLSCPALVLILDGGNNDGAKWCAQLFGRLGFDEPTAALALSALADDGTRRIVRALTRHAEPLIAPGLRDKLRPFLPSSLLNSIDDAELQDLFVAVKAKNLHRVLDAETASRPIGLGLFPAACLLNHDCQPNACLSFANNGRTLHIRAISDIAAGDDAGVQRVQLFSRGAAL